MDKNTSYIILILRLNVEDKTNSKHLCPLPLDEGTGLHV